MKKIKLSWLIVLFTITFVMDVFSMKLSEWPKIIKRDRIMKQQKQEKALQQYDKSLDTLYEMHCVGTAELYIPKEELVDFNGKQANLNELFKKHNIGLGFPYGQWKQKKSWEKVYSKLIGQTKQEKTDAMFAPDELQRLLVYVKTIFKKFLITNNNDFFVGLKNYIGGQPEFNKLFIYAKQERDNAKNKLTPSLSQKFLVIYDKQACKYVLSEKSPEIIDSILNFSIHQNAQISVDYDHTQYELSIYSQL